MCLKHVASFFKVERVYAIITMLFFFFYIYSFVHEMQIENINNKKNEERKEEEEENISRKTG